MKAQFFADLLERHESGAREYGETAYSKDVQALLDEVQQEAIDICGWGYFVWERVERMREKLKEATDLKPGQSVFSDGCVVNRKPIKL